MPTSASPNNFVIAAGSGGVITDQSGINWAISSSGQVVIGGKTDTSTGGVAKLAFVNNVVWQGNGIDIWWSNPSGVAGVWTPPIGAHSPLGTAPAAPAPSSAALPIAYILAQITAQQATLARAGTALGQLAAVVSGEAPTTPSGVPLPLGWALHHADIFGTGPGCSIGNVGQLHASYNEGNFFQIDNKGLVTTPNTVVNNEQQTYRHFEDVIVFTPDHLTIQARGHPDGSISSGLMCSHWSARSFAIEQVWKIPNVMGAWPAGWVYANAPSTAKSELDWEQPIGPWNSVHTVGMGIAPRPAESEINIVDPHFGFQYLVLTNGAFDASSAAHTYTTIYDDTGAGTMSRYIDGSLIYVVTPWKWNAALGGTGNGPDACEILNLAVGGDWPGNVPNPAAFSADFDIYSVRYYTPAGG